MLFADAATGARSTSMVSQGRVGAIIAAKPEQRRTLLEEAAGITGLHSRRHEAELRLNATENNLERVKDVLKAQDEQLTILKKQSKQAERYKYIQKDITKARARLFYKKWIDEKDKLKNANEKIQSETNVVNDQTQVVAQINVEFEKVQESLPNLRLQESKVAAELQKYSISLENQEKEIERANIAVDETKVRIEQIKNDIDREKFLFEDAKQKVLDAVDRVKASIPVPDFSVIGDKITALAMFFSPTRILNSIGDAIEAADFVTGTGFLKKPLLKIFGTTAQTAAKQAEENIQSDIDINAMQSGGFLQAGKFALVGEQGPELIMSKAPAQVFSEQRTDQLGMAALNRLTGGGDAGGGGSMFINQGNNVQNVSRSISPTFIVNQDTVLTTISKSLAM